MSSSSPSSLALALALEVEEAAGEEEEAVLALAQQEQLLPCVQAGTRGALPRWTLREEEVRELEHRWRPHRAFGR